MSALESRSIPAEPRARCKVCGSADIIAACHHCASTLCEDHAVNGAKGSREFRGLDVSKKGRDEEPRHCADCVHRLVSGFEVAALIAVGLVMAGVTIWFSSSQVVRLFAALVIALVAAALGLLLLQERREERLARCPVIPEVDSQRTVETYRFTSTLDPNGRWHHRADKADGVARADLRFGPDDVKRVADFTNSSGLAYGPGLLHAGFVVLSIGDPAAVDGINIVDDGDRFGAERISIDPSSMPYLTTGLPPEVAARVFDPDRSGGPNGRPDDAQPSNGRRASSVHRWEKRFDLRLADGGLLLPVRIFPALAPDSERRTLEFHIDWRNHGSPTDLLADRVLRTLGESRPTHIDFLEIRLPPTMLGKIAPIEGDPIIDDIETDAGRFKRVRWEQVSIALSDSSKRLSVRFENQIPADLRIDGDIAVVFDKSVAGIEGMTWFDPLGRPLQTPGDAAVSKDGATAAYVDVAFDFSMASLPYEASLVRRERPIRANGDILSEVRPDHTTAIEIAHKLTEADFTIYEIRESTFSPSDRSAVENRVWELRGRHFVNTAPLDFQIKVTGADLRRRLAGSPETYEVAGVTLAGQARVANPETLEQFKAGLHTIEEQTLAALSRLAGQPSPSALGSGHQGDDEVNNLLSESSNAMSSMGADGSQPSSVGSGQARTYDITHLYEERSCSMCGLTIGERDDFSLCHHCGRLLCAESCSINVRRDPAFSRGAGRVETNASHCVGCVKHHHARSHLAHRLGKSRALAFLQPRSS